MRKKILFLCTGNSCRSQMAEGYGKHFLSDNFDIYSAGVETHGLNPKAVEVMAEDGVDISSQESQNISLFKDIGLDLVITVCGDAHERCPVFPWKTKVIHKGFLDPAKAEGTPDEVMAQFRTVRDQIKAFVEKEVAGLI